MRECQECGAWTYTHGHHKIPKGRDKRGWDFPGNIIHLCLLCHMGDNGPHHCRAKALEYFRDVQLYLKLKLTEPHYTPDALSATIQLPLKQAYKVVRLLRPAGGGYRKEDIIYRLLGNRYDWGERDAV